MTEKESGVRIPTWAISIIILLLLNMIGGAFSYGHLSADVQELKAKVDKLENKFVYGGQ